MFRPGYIHVSQVVARVDLDSWHGINRTTAKGTDNFIQSVHPSMECIL